MILEWLVGLFRPSAPDPDVGVARTNQALQNVATLNQMVLEDKCCDLDALEDSINSISLNWKKKDTDRLKGGCK
jgi:hypothetical protein